MRFGARLQVWDLERPSEPHFDAAAHTGIVNAVDGFGGKVQHFYIHRHLCVTAL